VREGVWLETVVEVGGVEVGCVEVGGVEVDSVDIGPGVKVEGGVEAGVEAESVLVDESA